MSRKSLLIFSLICLLSSISCQHKINFIPENNHPKNIILLIGDGMGSAQIQAAMIVKDSPLNIEKCKKTGMSKTSSATNYITDSGAAATAMACGVKTYNGAVGVDSLGNAIKSILDYAIDAGLATGLIATVQITHATPASFIAHEKSRKNYEEIAMAFVDTDIDIFIGSGLDNFNKRIDNLNLVDQLINKGYQIALTMDELNQIQKGKIAGLLELGAISNGRGDMLLESSMKAMEILSRNKKGFFLMIEGSRIDYGGHKNDINYIVSELLDFDKSVGAAIDFADIYGNTLVVVTADHETGGLTIINENILTDSLAVQFSTDYHTSTMVPVYAYGVGAENFTGIYENTAIFDKMMKALNLVND
jgi:alkaline phosphatase